MTIEAHEPPQALAGRRVLIVEDEILLAMDLEMCLEGEGCEVLEPARSVERALHMLESERPDAVTLDMNLDGESSLPVATALKERNIPFVVVTGYAGKHEEDPAFRNAPLVKKPYETGELVGALIHLLK